MKSLRNSIMGSITTAVLFGLPMACDPSSAPPTAKTTASDSSLPKELFVGQQPAGAVGVLEAKRNAKAGDRVTITGRIGGSLTPFVSNRAVFTMVDASLKTCAEMPEDSCLTPADYCCEDRASLARAMASVSIVDRNGKPLAIALESEGSLKPLMLIAVEGTLQPTEGGVFSVNADHIYKIPNDPLASKIK